MIWPTQQELVKEAEGKRDSKDSSRLNYAGTEAGVLPRFPETKSVEELVAPISSVLDDLTGGWALSYANLEPETERSPIGISFLLTNLAYGACGLLLVQQQNLVLGGLTELACIASFGYHYSQLKFGQAGSRIVRLSLLVDYLFALSAILVGSTQYFVLAHQMPSLEVLGGGALAVASLGACWVWEAGLPYIVFHSLWHLFSAYTGYMIGSAVV